MALSMDEQRMLAEIERRLTAEDPGLATRLSSFKRPAVPLKSPRSRVIGSVFAIAAALVLSVMVYAMIPFRAHAPGSTTGSTTDPQATGGVSASAPATPGHKATQKKPAVSRPAAAKSAKSQGSP